MKGLKNKEGCQIVGVVQIHKVPGNFHISGHKNGEAYQKLYYTNYAIDMTHKINHLSFGDKDEADHLKGWGLKLPNELNGIAVNQNQVVPFGNMHVEYILDVTEAEYEVDPTNFSRQLQGVERFSGFQYRGMRTILVTGGMGTIQFKYDISPVKIHYTVYKQGWNDFIVHLCAIIGGMFAAAGVLESLMRNSLCLFTREKPKKFIAVGEQGVQMAAAH